jgi:predicted phosphatase
MIYNKIIAVKIKFHNDTGKIPRNVYIGRHDMKELVKWAKDNGYMIDQFEKNIEGLHRPEVSGLYCFEVNADRHLECA